MRKNILTATAAALLFTSCGIFPQYIRPEMGVAYEESVETLSWREMYTDPNLQQLIERALSEATSLQIASLKVEEAEAALVQARLQFLPSLSASGTADLKSGDLGAGLNSSWQLDIFGKMRNAKRAAFASLQESLAYEQAVKSSLIAAVAQAYYSLLLLDSQLDISVKTLDNWDRTISVLESLKAAGKTNNIAILQAKAKKMKLESSSIGLRGSIEVAENSLRSLVGDQNLTIDRNILQDSGLLPEAITDVPLSAVASRPDVRQAEMALAEAFYSTAEARSAFYPDITITGSTSWTSGADDLIWNAIGGLAAPIFSRGTKKAALKVAQARQEEARQGFRQTLLNAGEEVNSAMAKCRTASERIEVDARQRDALADAVEKIELTMLYSSTNYLEVLTAQQSLLDAELSLVGDIKELISARIALYQALGGGVE